MSARISSKYFHILIMIFITAGLFTSAGAAEGLQKSAADTVQVTSVYLPLSMKNHPQTKVFGAQVVNLGDEIITPLAANSGIYWVRIDAFDWSKIEPNYANPGVYHWDVVDEQSLLKARENGMHVIAIIRNAPSWAQDKPPYLCGPIKKEAMPNYIEFVTALVKRYSASPYNIKYWELGNEPDASPGEVPPTSVYGCWGNLGDNSKAGEIYGEMLKLVYPAIKAADAEAKVLIGGLLMDCDACSSGKFMDGIMRTWNEEPGDTFDYANFHGYSYATTPTGAGTLGIDENPAGKWDDGGVVLGKIDLLRDVMGKYGVNKPIFHTEGSLICHPDNTANCSPPGAPFEETQADYVIWLYTRNLAEGLVGTIWYQFEGPGWRYGGLLDGNQDPKPAYDALQFITKELGSASYIGKVNGASEVNNPAVIGYKFSTDLKIIWVLWSPDGKSKPISLPQTIDRVLNKYGAQMGSAPSQVSSPIYVEFDK